MADAPLVSDSIASRRTPHELSRCCIIMAAVRGAVALDALEVLHEACSYYEQRMQRTELLNSADAAEKIQRRTPRHGALAEAHSDRVHANTLFNACVA